MDSFKKFVVDYRGAIIGAIIAMILLFTNLYKLIIGIILIFIGIFVGNYVQHNKSEVKEKIKNFICGIFCNIYSFYNRYDLSDSQMDVIIGTETIRKITNKYGNDDIKSVEQIFR